MNASVSYFSLPELLIFSQFAVPAFPGATSTCWMCGDWASFQASACSRPPPPTTNTFTTIVPWGNENASTLTMAFTWLIKHPFNCVYVLTYSERRVRSCEQALTFIGCKLFCNVSGGQMYWSRKEMVFGHPTVTPLGPNRSFFLADDCCRDFPLRRCVD